MSSDNRAFVTRVAPLLLITVILGNTRAPADEIEIAELERTDAVDFQRELLPVLRKKCLACHNATDAESDLVLETPATIAKGGALGPAVAAGQPDESLILQLAAGREEPIMPPEENEAGALPMTPDELALLKLWIEQGATGEVSSRNEPIAWQALPTTVNPIYAVAQSRNGRFLVAGRANQITVYDLLLDRVVAQLTDSHLDESPVAADGPVAHLDLVQALAINSDNQWIASGGYRTVKLWRREPAIRRQTDLPEQPITAIAVGDEPSVYAAGFSGEILQLSLESDNVTHRKFRTAGTVTWMGDSPDSRNLATRNEAGMLCIWDEDTNQIASIEHVQHACWLASDRLLTANDDQKLQIWKIGEEGSATLETDLDGDFESVTSLAAINESQFVVADKSKRLRIWSTQQESALRQFECESEVRQLAAHWPSRRLISIDEHHVATLWNLDSDEPIARLEGNAELTWRREQEAVDLAIAERHVSNLQEDLKKAKQRIAEEKSNLEKAEAEVNRSKEALKQAETEASKAIAEKEGAERNLAAAKDQLAQAENDGRGSDETPAANEADKLVAQAKKAVDEAKMNLESKTKAVAKSNDVVAEKQQALQSAEKSLGTAREVLATAQQVVETLQPQIKSADEDRQLAEVSKKLADQAALNPKHLAIDAAISVDGQTIATVNAQGTLAVWRSSDGRPIETFRIADCQPAGLVMRGDHQIVVIAVDGRRFDVDLDADWTLNQTIGSPDETSSLAGRMTAICFSPDGKLVAVGGGDPSRLGELKVFRLDGQRLLDIQDAHSDTIFGLAFSPDGTRLASCSADRFMKIFDTSTGQLVRTFEGHTHHVLSVGWRADGRALATAGADKVVKLWDARDGTQLQTIQGFGKEVTSLQWAGASDHLFAASGDQKVYRCDMEGKMKPVAQADDFLYVLSSDLKGQSVAFAGEDSTVRIIDGDGKTLLELKPGG